MITRLVVQSVVTLAVIGALLLGAGGNWLWPQAWAFLGEDSLLSAAISAWLLKHDPELLRARLTSPLQETQRPAVRIVVALIFALFVGWLVLIGLDAERFRWSRTPFPVQILGAALVALGMGLAWETFRYNSFAAPQVRAQPERGQRVIDTGPYRFVRHPMYAGAALYILGAPLMMGSLWGLAGSAALILGMAARALGEEAVLKQDLPGYADYMRKTRWRIVPGVW